MAKLKVTVLPAHSSLKVFQEGPPHTRRMLGWLTPSHADPEALLPGAPVMGIAQNPSERTAATQRVPWPGALGRVPAGP